MCKLFVSPLYIAIYCYSLFHLYCKTCRAKLERRSGRERDNSGLNVRIYGDATSSVGDSARHGTARSTVQRNALIRAAACAEFERLTDPRDTHVFGRDYPLRRTILPDTYRVTRIKRRSKT